MQEDVVGTTPTAREEYATCPECGSVFRRREGHTEPAGLNDDTRSEFTELCPDCDRLDRQGELPLLGEVQE